ncbi:MAG: O-antigen ligase family protein [Acidobacteria bacterium]|nr:O-antigen ligase family protein [Acidobacteriota bacterium]
MAGSVHLVEQRAQVSGGLAAAKFLGWVETAIFICLAMVALTAPVSTKAAVNSFRAATVLWVLLTATGKRRLTRQPLALPLVVFLICTAISSALSLDPRLSWGRMRTVSLIFLAIVVGQATHSLRQLKTLAALLIASCLLTVLYTAWQYSAGIGVQATASGPALVSLGAVGLAPGDIIRKLGGTTVRSPRALRGQQFSSTPVELLLWRETPNALQPFHIAVDAKRWEVLLRSPGLSLRRAHPPRAQGFFRHYFPFSEFLVFAALLMGGFAVSPALDGKRRISLVLAFAATAATLTLTLTRISLVSLAVGTLLLIAMPTKGRRRKASIIAFLLLSLAAIAWVQHHRAGPESDPGNEYRLLMWRDSLKMVRAHPLFGVGLDSVAGDWQRWNLEAYRRFPLHSHFHSTPIQLAVECGLPALAVWIWLLAGDFAFLLHEYRTSSHNDWFASGLLLGALGCLVAFVLTGFVQYNFGDAEAMIVFWLIMGMAFALNRLTTEGAGGNSS